MRQDRNTRQDTTTNQDISKKHKDKRKAITGCALLAAGIVLTILARSVEGLAQWYSAHVYPVWVNMLGRLTGMFPFSVAEILLYLFLLALLLSAGRLIVRLASLGCGRRKKSPDGREKKVQAGKQLGFYIFCMWPAAGSITTEPPFRKARGSWRRNIRSGSLQRSASG